MADYPRRSLFRRLIGGLFAWIGFIFVLLIILVLGVRFLFAPGGTHISDASILSIDLSESFPDGPQPSSIARLISSGKPSLNEVINTVHRAGDDTRIRGLVARLGDGGLDLAQVQELRDAIVAFRAKGKFAYAYSDSFGELGSGMGSYYFAAAFDEIWLQPLSMVGLIGLRSEQPFLRGTFDKLGIEPKLDHRSEYKTFMNMFTETKMTPAHREETESLLRSLLGQIVRGIAQDRKLSEDQVRALVDKGPFMDQDALVAHLVDHIGYRDDAVDAAKKRADGSGSLVSFEKYADAVEPLHQSGPVVAVIYANGLIQRGSSVDNPLTGNSALGAETIARAFREAAADSQVRAILFRIDSPGGSAVASETIWQETLRAKKSGKPLIVSMGGVAGSGGYYIAAAADKIIAEPATLTGSIGVVAGKMLINGLSEKLGVSWDSAEIGAHAGMFSPTEDFTPEGHELFEHYLDVTYAGFKDRVAQGRGLDPTKVEELAKGRVWTGEDAKARGLVDELGGFDTALTVAKKAADIPADSDVTIREFPEEHRSLLAQLTGGVDPSNLLAAVQPLLRLLSLTSAPPGALTMPPVQIH